MKTKYSKWMLAVLAIFTSLSSSFAQLAKNWDMDFGGKAGGQRNVGQKIIQMHDGGFLIGGTSNGNSSNVKSLDSKGGNDYWLVKTDAGGKHLLDITFGGSGEDILTEMIATPDGGYLLGGFSNSAISGDKSQNSIGVNDYWIVKLDGNFNKQWDKTVGGQGANLLKSIVVTTTGYLVIGESTSNSGFDKTENCKGGSDIWVVFLDYNGNKIWDKTYGGVNDDTAVKAVAYSDGYIISAISSSPVGGDKTTPNKGFGDYWILKIKLTGILSNPITKIWDATIGGALDDNLTDIIATHDGSLIMLGSSFSDIGGDKTKNCFDPSIVNHYCDFWAIKVIENSTHTGVNKLWDNIFGGQYGDLPMSICPSNDNQNYYLAGYSASSASPTGNGGNISYIGKGGNDYYIVKINNSNGSKIFDLGYGGSGSEDRLAKMISCTDGYALVGSSNSGISGDKTQNLFALGNWDYWIVKLKYSSSLARNANTISAEEDSNNIFSKTGMEGNINIYPNPSNSAIDITYSADNDSSLAIISLFNFSGAKVIEFIDSNLSSGNHTLTLNSKEYALTPGVYTLTIQMEGKIQTKKIIIIE